MIKTSPCICKMRETPAVCRDEFCRNKERLAKKRKKRYSIKVVLAALFKRTVLLYKGVYQIHDHCFRPQLVF